MLEKLREEATETLDFLRHHPEERMAYTPRLKYLLDTISRLETAEEEGFEIGFKKGFEKGFKIGVQIAKHKVAKKMKLMDCSMSDIIKITKLSPEEVENL
jgi:predicted transposase/invertase (TIGR01784 family)